MENSREFDRIVDGNLAEFAVRHCTGVCAETKDSRIMTTGRLGERRAIRKIRMQDFIELGVGYAELSTPDRGDTINRGVVKRVT